MGSGAWDGRTYARASADRKTAGVDDFHYHTTTSSRPSSDWKAHPTLDPHGLKLRESRDSVEHPESLAIAVFFDVTGSMGSIPRILQQNLEKLMTIVMAKGGIEHSQLLVGAIGDRTCDRVPFQVGQFESDNRIDEQLRNIFLEAGGGGHITESYQLALYVAARKMAMDCLEKRGKKGYLFLIGDEVYYPRLSREDLGVFGEDAQEGIETADLFAEAKEKFEIFMIIPTGSAHGQEHRIYEAWAEYLGQHVMRIEDPTLICELIASTIAVTEGADLTDVVAALDLDTKAKIVTEAIAPYVSAGGAKSGAASATIPDAPAAVERV